MVITEPTRSPAPGELPVLAPGTAVEVRTQFERTWANGFEVVEVVGGAEDRYRVRRTSDGRELPTAFPRSEVRRARRRGQWWY